MNFIKKIFFWICTLPPSARNATLRLHPSASLCESFRTGSVAGGLFREEGRFGLQIFSLAGVIFLSSILFFPKTSRAEGKKTDVLFFYATGCSHCEKVKPHIKEFAEKNADSVEIHWFNVYKDEEARQLFDMYLKKYYATSGGVPSLFIGDKLIQGDAPIIEGLDSAVSNCPNCNLKMDLKSVIDLINNPPEDPFPPKPPENKVTLWQVVSAGIIDAINPCAIGVLIFLLAFLLGIEASKKRMLKIGGTYIFAVFLAYWLAGMGILRFLTDFKWTKQVLIGAGAIVIIVGIINFAQALWSKMPYKLAIPEDKKPFIKNLMAKASIPAVFIAGFIVSALELPCTGAVYLGILSALACSASKCAGNLYLLLYNFIFVLPLIIILLLVIWGWNIEKISQFSDKNKKLIRAIMGVVMVLLGIWLIL